MKPPPLVLASTSRYRQGLLTRLRIPFDTIAPGVDETLRPGEPPAERAHRLASEKAMAVTVRFEGATVIGGDQVATARGDILDKPGSGEACRAQLAKLSGVMTEFHTAVAVLAPGQKAPLVHVDLTRVWFRVLGAGEIDRYVEAEQPFDCAGGFKSEGLGVTLFDRIESSDPTALIGMPLMWLAGTLRRAGYALP